MNAQEYLNRIDAFGIRPYGFDTHARVLGIDHQTVKDLWNEATDCEFKRIPRTEYSMTFMPEISTKAKPYWKLSAPRGYLIFHLTPTAPIIVPDGFITDKGSIPWIFRNIISHDDREMIMAYLVHDLECEMKRMTRFNVDGLLYEIGTEMEASWIKRNIVYTAVRAAAWRKVPDSVVNGFNVSKYNRELITKAEAKYVASDKIKGITKIMKTS